MLNARGRKTWADFTSMLELSFDEDFWWHRYPIVGVVPWLIALTIFTENFGQILDGWKLYWQGLASACLLNFSSHWEQLSLIFDILELSNFPGFLSFCFKFFLFFFVICYNWEIHRWLYTSVTLISLQGNFISDLFVVLELVFDVLLLWSRTSFFLQSLNTN